MTSAIMAKEGQSEQLVEHSIKLFILLLANFVNIIEYSLIVIYFSSWRGNVYLALMTFQLSRIALNWDYYYYA